MKAILFFTLISPVVFAQEPINVDREKTIYTPGGEEIVVPKDAVIFVDPRVSFKQVNNQIYINQNNISGFLDVESIDESGRLKRNAYVYPELGYNYNDCRGSSPHPICSRRTYLAKDRFTEKIIPQKFPTHFRGRGDPFMIVSYLDGQRKSHYGITRDDLTSGKEPTGGNICVDCAMGASEPAIPSPILQAATQDSGLDKKAIGDKFKEKVDLQFFNSACTNFIQSNGDLGEYGRKVVSALADVDEARGTKCFSETIDVSSVCPKFKDFSAEKKEYFWVWAFASIAQAESSCDPKAVNPDGTNDIADGLMQMEYTWGQRKSAGRDRRFCPHRPINSQDVDFQIRCSASILVDTNCRLFDPPALTSRKGYWALLRGDNGDISKNITSFPGCR